jgi:hypothetical protein
VSIQFELEHPHDLITRFFLIDSELFGSLLDNYGQSEIIRYIDLKSLKSESPTLVDSNLQERIGDLFFSAKFKNGDFSKIFLFFEHQSRKDRSFWLRCFRSFVEFYEQYDAEPNNKIGKGGKYPYPLVVVLYHGKVPWEKLLQLRDSLSLPPGIDRNVLWFPVILIDLSRVRRENLNKGHKALLALLDTLISYSDGTLSESFDRIVGYFTEIKNDRRTYGWLTSVTRYFVSLTKIDKEVITKTVSKIIDKRRTKKMVLSTMEELLIEGEKIGIEKGIKIGRENGIKIGREDGIEIGREKGQLECKINDVMRILKSRFKKIPAATVRAIRSYKDLIALDSLIDRALDCETLSEFEWNLAHR